MHECNGERKIEFLNKSRVMFIIKRDSNPRKVCKPFLDRRKVINLHRSLSIKAIIGARGGAIAFEVSSMLLLVLVGASLFILKCLGAIFGRLDKGWGKAV